MEILLKFKLFFSTFLTFISLPRDPGSWIPRSHILWTLVIRVHTAPYRVIQDPMGPYWTIQDHTGPYWTMWDHMATSSEAINLAGHIFFKSYFRGTFSPGRIVSWGTLLPGHIVSRGALSPGAHCLRGTLSPGAHCLPGHIVSGVYCLRGILSWRHIVSGRVVSGA